MLIKFSTALISLALFSPMSLGPEPSQAPPQPQPPVQILMEGDWPSIRLLKDELRGWSFRMRKPIVYVDAGSPSYDLRIIVAADEASKSESCTASCTNAGTCTDATASSTCSVTVRFYFASAAGTSADGKFLFAESASGSAPRNAIEPLARRVAKWLSVLPKLSHTPSK